MQLSRRAALGVLPLVFHGAAAETAEERAIVVGQGPETPNMAARAWLNLVCLSLCGQILEVVEFGVLKVTLHLKELFAALPSAWLCMEHGEYCMASRNSTRMDAACPHCMTTCCKRRVREFWNSGICMSLCD